MLLQLIHESLQEVSNLSRHVNQYLGAIVVPCVLWRGIPLLLDRTRWQSWRSLHRVLAFTTLAGYGGCAAWASVYYEHTTVEAGPHGIVVFVLNIGVILLCIFWPHSVQDNTSVNDRQT